MSPTWTRALLRHGSALVAGALVISGGAVAATAPAAMSERVPLSPCVSRDNGVPRATEMEFSPASVDVSGEDARVRLTLRVADTAGPGTQASGVAGVWATVSGPDYTFHEEMRLERHEGDAWTVRFTLPRQAPAGDYRVTGARIYDKAGNDSPSAGDATRGRAPFDTVLHVDSVADPDREAPTATALSISPRRVDTTRHARDVHVVVAAQDAGSGVGSVNVDAHAGPYSERVALRPVGDGTFAGDLRIHRWRGTRTWKVDHIQVFDRIGNVDNYRHSRLRALGGHTFEVFGRGDRAAPAAGGLRLSPSRVDVRRTGDTVHFRARLRDRSGVSEAWASGADLSVPLHLVSGTRRHGTWQGSVRLDRCTRLPERRTVPFMFTAVDRAENLLETVPWRLRARHRDNTAPRVTPQQGPAPRSGPMWISFDEPVNGLDGGSARVRPWTGSEYGEPVAGSWNCRDRHDRTTSCTTGRVRSAGFVPVAPFGPGTHRVVLNPSGTLRVRDLAGNPFRRAGVNVDVG